MIFMISVIVWIWIYWIILILL